MVEIFVWTGLFVWSLVLPVGSPNTNWSLAKSQTKTDFWGNPGGGLGTCLFSLHMFCGSGEGLWPGSPVYYVAGTAGPCRPVKTVSNGCFAYHGCPLSPILFVIFMARILRCSRGGDDIQLVGWWWCGPDGIISLWQCSTHRIDGQLSEMRLTWISTSKSVAMVPSRKPMDFPLQAENESLPQLKVFQLASPLDIEWDT